jgi:hypothetical protein
MPLFSSEVMQLLTPLPNETLFSILSRHHAFWGHSLARKTSLLLFGKERGGYHHDLPNCVHAFCERTENRYGSSAEICLERTLLRFYRCFISTNETDNAIAVMSGTNVCHLKLRLGILTSRFRANHPLKACPSCVRQDIETKGWSYWHIEHQYPGVWYCNIHGELLGESEVKSNGVERFQWGLPNFHQLKIPLVDCNAVPQIAGLSKFIVELVHAESELAIDFSCMYLVYRSALKEQGYQIGKRFTFANITSSFQQYLLGFSGITELRCVLKNDTEIQNQLQSLLRPPRARAHPLRHLLIMHWLFGTYENFLSQYNNEITNSARKFVSTPEQTDNKLSRCNVEKRMQFNLLVDQIQNKTISIRAAANQIGIDTATAMVWATQEGLAISRRPKRLTEDIRQKIIQKLNAGIAKRDIAAEHTISIVTVTHVLRTEVGLNRQWQEACFRAKQNNARNEWSQLLENNGIFGVKFIRVLSPSTYAWLYRNDREWLMLNSPVRKLVSREKRSSVNWDERDLILSQAIEQAALQVQLSLGRKKMMLWHLYQKVPELKAKMGHLKQLPLTAQTLFRILGKNISANKVGAEKSIGSFL